MPHYTAFHLGLYRQSTCLGVSHIQRVDKGAQYFKMTYIEDSLDKIQLFDSLIYMCQ